MRTFCPSPLLCYIDQNLIKNQAVEVYLFEKPILIRTPAGK